MRIDRAHLKIRLALWMCSVLLASAAGAAEPPPLLLAEVYRGQVDPAACLVSEKLDGVRAYWDGRTLLTRGGKEVGVPAWFAAALPAQPLDGELWLGRGSFDRLSALVRRAVPDDAAWRQVRYMIFELPEAPGSFAERAARIREVVAEAGVPWLQAVEQFRVADRRALERRLDAVVRAGGEGLMLHRADAPYLTGRSDVLLKLKPWLDAEAEVIGHSPGEGRYAGMLGALRVRSADGREFSLGSGLSDDQRRHPPPPGTIVTYRYRDLTPRGLPRFASFLRVRDDP